MAITRRQFIRRTGLATAGGLLGPSLFLHPLVRQALAATTNRYFIVLFLDGGNDGLNTVTPIDDGGESLRTDYEFARRSGNGGLRLYEPSSGGDTTNLLPIGTDPATGALLGLHPGFYGRSESVTQSGDPGYGGLKALYDAGMVAVIQGCGYPDFSLSHEESRFIWQTGNPFNVGAYAGTGWVGRHLAGQFTGTQIPGVCVEEGVSGEFRQFVTSVLAIRRLSSFDFPRDGDYPDDFAAKDAAYLALCSEASGSGVQPYEGLGNSGTATFDGTSSYPPAHDVYESDRSSWSDGYDNGGQGGAINRSLARDFREIAKMIYAQERIPALANINARYFRVSNGGYDTHSDQRANDPNGQHYALHSEVGGTLKHFFDDLAAMDPGLPDRVAVMVWSEFSRRVFQNDNGTDHGSQGPMFVIGGKVNGGIYGRHPNINSADWADPGNKDNANTIYRQTAGHQYRSTDIRDVYGTILTNWLGMSQLAAQAILPLDSGSPDTTWTVRNFDLRQGQGLPGDLPLFNP